jgi:hypothetical protein
MVILSSNTLLLSYLDARESIRPERCEPIPSPATHQRLTHSKKAIFLKGFRDRTRPSRVEREGFVNDCSSFKERGCL